jgi:hypothetical protein
MLIYAYSPLKTIIGLSSSYHALIEDMVFYRLQYYVQSGIDTPFRFTTEVDTRFRTAFSMSLLIEYSI